MTHGYHKLTVAGSSPSPPRNANTLEDALPSGGQASPRFVGEALPGPIVDARLVHALSQIVAKEGEAIFTAPARIRGMLADACPDLHKEIRWLVAAAEERIPALIRSQAAVSSPDAAIAMAALRLEQATGFSRVITLGIATAWASAIEVLVPPLLAIHRHPDGVLVTARAEGRDAAQAQRAIGRELEAAGVGSGSLVLVGSSPAADVVVAAVLAKGAARVVLEGPPPVQVHPPLLGKVKKNGAAVRFAVTPSGDPEWQGCMLDRELPIFLAALPLLAGRTVTIAWPGGDPASSHIVRLVEACISKQATKVWLDVGTGTRLQLHPKSVPHPAASATSVAAVPAARPRVGTSAAVGAAADVAAHNPANL